MYPTSTTSSSSTTHTPFLGDIGPLQGARMFNNMLYGSNGTGSSFSMLPPGQLQPYQGAGTLSNMTYGTGSSFSMPPPKQLQPHQGGGTLSNMTYGIGSSFSMPPPEQLQPYQGAGTLSNMTYGTGSSFSMPPPRQLQPYQGAGTPNNMMYESTGGGSSFSMPLQANVTYGSAGGGSTYDVPDVEFKNPPYSSTQPTDADADAKKRKKGNEGTPKVVNASVSTVAKASASKVKPNALGVEQFLAVRDRPLKKAAKSLKVTELEFINRACQLKIFEWLGEGSEIERHTYRIEGVKKDILAKVTRCNAEKSECQAKVMRFPGNYILRRVKESIAEAFNLPTDALEYEYKFVDGSWVDLKTPEEWDICLEMWIDGAQPAVEVRVFPNPNVDVSGKGKGIVQGD